METRRVNQRTCFERSALLQVSIPPSMETVFNELSFLIFRTNIVLFWLKFYRVKILDSLQIQNIGWAQILSGQNTWFIANGFNHVRFSSDEIQRLLDLSVLVARLFWLLFCVCIHEVLLHSRTIENYWRELWELLKSELTYLLHNQMLDSVCNAFDSKVHCNLIKTLILGSVVKSVNIKTEYCYNEGFIHRKYSRWESRLDRLITEFRL